MSHQGLANLNFGQPLTIACLMIQYFKLLSRHLWVQLNQGFYHIILSAKARSHQFNDHMLRLLDSRIPCPQSIRERLNLTPKRIFRFYSSYTWLDSRCRRSWMYWWSSSLLKTSIHYWSILHMHIWHDVLVSILYAAYHFIF